MTKADLLKALEGVPDDALVVYFNGNEELDIATHVIVHRPEDKYYHWPEDIPPLLGPVWMELGHAN